MFFEFTRCQNIYRNFFEFFGSIYNILSIKYEFIDFLNLINSKIWIWPELLSRPNPSSIYIWWLLLTEHVPNHKTVFPDSFPISQNCSPKFGGIPNPASNYFQSMYRRWNPRIPLCLFYRGLRLGASGSPIGPLNLHQSANLCSASTRSSSPSETSTIVTHKVSSFLLFLVCVEAPLASLGGGAPCPLSPPPRSPSPRRWLARLAPPPPARPWRRSAPRRRPAWPPPPPACLTPSSSLFHGWDEEDNGFAKLPLTNFKTVRKNLVQFKTVIAFAF
jgi:hypothetical protein